MRECLPNYWPYVKEIHQWPVISDNKEPLMQSFDVCFMVSQNLYDSTVQENHTKPMIMEDRLNIVKYSII